MAEANFVTVRLSYGLIQCHLSTAFSRGWHYSTTWLPSRRWCLRSIYTVRANGCRSFCSTLSTSRDVWTKEPMDMKCYVSSVKAAQRDVWDDFLIVEKHPLPHIRGRGSFSKVGSFTLGECMATTETLTTPHLPFARLPPLLALPGFKHKPDHLRSSSRIVHHCIATDPVLTWLHWDIWSYSGCHLFPRRDRSQNWDPWYAHLLAALVAVHHVMWQSKLCTHYYLKFPIKDEQKEWTRGRVVIRFFHFFKYVSHTRTAMGTWCQLCPGSHWLLLSLLHPYGREKYKFIDYFKKRHKKQWRLKKTIYRSNLQCY